MIGNGNSNGWSAVQQNPLPDPPERLQGRSPRRSCTIAFWQAILSHLKEFTPLYAVNIFNCSACCTVDLLRIVVKACEYSRPIPQIASTPWRMKVPPTHEFTLYN